MTLTRAAAAAVLLLGLAPLLAAAPGAAAATPARSLCAPPADTVAPAVTQVTFGKSSIDLNSGSRVQTVTATATDSSGNGAASGVADVRVEIHGNGYGHGVRLALSSGTPAAGTWTGQFQVSKYARPGTYSIEFLYAVDADGNDQAYPGYGTYPEGPDALSLHPADDPTFTVTGTPATRPHHSPGRLTALTFRPATVDTTSTARRVHVHARFRGPAPSHVSLAVDSSKRTRHVHFVYLRASLHAVGHRSWSGRVRVPRWLGRQVLQVSLYAEYGRRYRPSTLYYDPDRLRHLHLASRLTVISGVDHTKPTLTKLSLSPASIDSTDGPERVTITAKATDTGSGVRYIDVSSGIRGGANGAAGGLYPFRGIGYLSSENFRVRLHQTRPGTWVGTTTVRQCVPSGTYKLDVDLRDAADNYRSYSTKQLAKAHLMSKVAVTSKHGDVVDPYVYSAATYGADSELFLNFSEGVADVSTSTLTVYALSPAAGRYTDPTPVTGLTCANGTTTVDCSGSGGLVTSAVLTIPSLEPGKKYAVYANLDDVTPQLTDGNGNPLRWNYDATTVKDS